MKGYGTSKSALDNTFDSTKSGYEMAKRQTADSYKLQLSDELAKLKAGYDSGMYMSDKDQNGNSVVHNVINNYKLQKEEEDKISADNARETVKNEIASMRTDPSNFYNENTLSEEGKARIISYIESNKAVLGEADYNAMLDAVNNMPVVTSEQKNKDKIQPMIDAIGEGDSSTKLSNFGAALFKIRDLSSGMSKDEYNAYYKALTSKSNRGAAINNYKVAGLGTGRNNDDIDVTIGGKKYDLQCGKGVDAEGEKILNWFTNGGDRQPENGRVCVVEGCMYIYTLKKGWRVVKSDGDNIEKAISAFLN